MTRRPLLAAALALGALATAAPGAHAFKVTTANVDFTSTAKGQRAQVAHVLSKQPDLVLLQETREIDLARARGVAGLGRYRVVQFWERGPFPRASSLLVRKARFQITTKGLYAGYRDRPAVDPPARYLPWAQLRDRATGRRLLAVSVHMPKASLQKPAFADAYRTMGANYVTLTKAFARRGIPVVTGGDWNQSVAKPNPGVDFDPFDVNARSGLRFNWQDGTPCDGTHGPGDIIDGIAYTPGALALQGQFCMAPKRSDHKPVVANLTFPGVPGS